MQITWPLNEPDSPFVALKLIVAGVLHIPLVVIELGVGAPTHIVSTV
jgi:hypothetical protein